MSPARCDLILLTWNRADLLIPCVDRILAHTKVPCRLLVIDNASTDQDAIAYLEQLSRSPGTDWVTIVVVRRPRNDGFAIGMNDGLSRATAPWICLLNNDILVTEGWLEELLGVAERHPEIGLLNPASNEFNVGPVRPGESIDEIARRLRARRGQWIENWFGVGFCLLFSREIVERVGYLDEGFTFLYSEDADFSFRVRALGRLCAIAQGAYVYHHQRSTLKQNPALLQRMKENEDRFYQKWPKERPCRVAYILSDPAETEVPAVRERIRRMANEGHRTFLFHTARARACLPPHFQVIPQPLAPLGFSGQAVARILAKKKGFHRIIVTRRGLKRVLDWLKPLHRADVVLEGS